MKIKLKNKRSLYGAGMFPFSLYIKYFGRPVYKFCRKNGLPKYVALTAAHTLGAFAHVGLFIGAFNMDTIASFLTSFIIWPPLFWFIHISYGRLRDRSRPDNTF